MGLDSAFAKIPQALKGSASVEDVIAGFNQEIVDATHDLVCAYKPNAAFYEAQGDQGLRALARTVRHIKDNYQTFPLFWTQNERILVAQTMATLKLHSISSALMRLLFIHILEKKQ